MIVYNKLIRDKIPEYIMKDNKIFHTKILNDKEFHEALITKVYEEFEEYIESESQEEAIEELADILQLINELAQINNTSMKEIEKIRLNKIINRGGFRKKIYLIEVED